MSNPNEVVVRIAVETPGMCTESSGEKESKVYGGQEPLESCDDSCDCSCEECEDSEECLGYTVVTRFGTFFVEAIDFRRSPAFFTFLDEDGDTSAVFAVDSVIAILDPDLVTDLDDACEGCEEPCCCEETESSD